MILIKDGDGRYKGKPVQDGVYIWKLHLKDVITDKKIEKRGTVTLIL